MKTTASYQTDFPTPARFIAYLILVCGFAFACCLTGNAQTRAYDTNAALAQRTTKKYQADNSARSAHIRSYADQRLARRLERALIPAREAAVSLESWMYNLEEYGVAGSFEQRLELEAWMTDVSAFYAEHAREEVVELEDWMTDPAAFGIHEYEEIPWEVADRIREIF